MSAHPWKQENGLRTKKPGRIRFNVEAGTQIEGKKAKEQRSMMTTY
jgi:hypothetical protein